VTLIFVGESEDDLAACSNSDDKVASRGTFEEKFNLLVSESANFRDTEEFGGMVAFVFGVCIMGSKDAEGVMLVFTETTSLTVDAVDVDDTNDGEGTESRGSEIDLDRV
jgi:hypothetical protein